MAMIMCIWPLLFCLSGPGVACISGTHCYAVSGKKKIGAPPSPPLCSLSSVLALLCAMSP
jgi:hypothetical protein